MVVVAIPFYCWVCHCYAVYGDRKLAKRTNRESPAWLCLCALHDFFGFGNGTGSGCAYIFSKARLRAAYFLGHLFGFVFGARGANAACSPSFTNPCTANGALLLNAGSDVTACRDNCRHINRRFLWLGAGFCG